MNTKTRSHCLRAALLAALVSAPMLATAAGSAGGTMRSAGEWPDYGAAQQSTPRSASTGAAVAAGTAASSMLRDHRHPGQRASGSLRPDARRAVQPMPATTAGAAEVAGEHAEYPE